ncbi:hypothetical protein GCM10009530_69000 [Microbispora corallina]|uniref:Uncharacterized protein n=1 Tax=Microbispora corallina TaxID=83302 RepID=A0ABQ4FSM4_9ACTN|nr:MULTISPECIES: hypothetical protein [Microbispora]ETK35740.1 hypothetical protein MPTA5024_12675 [Microbispora sp. ATCC PTA-5024]GIH37799.1 hypothetical protein Mco01_07990 [Microbispora corallina]
MGRHRRGKTQGIETVGDLIEALERFDPDLEIRFAVQPRMPMGYRVGPLAEFDDILWIGEATSDGYVPDGAANRLGWR